MPQTYDPDPLEQVNLNDPDELEAQLELLDVVRSRRPTSTQESSWLKRCFCRCLFLGVVVIPVVALIAVETIRGNNVPFSSSSAPLPLPEPPSYLASKCSKQSILSEEGREACMRLCEVSECCDFPANMALSCLSGNERKCLRYHSSCVILRNNESATEVEVPSSLLPAPLELSTICKPENLISHNGFTECQEACEVASCCYDKNVTPSCADHFDECDSYAPCLNMAATNHIHKDIVSEIESRCYTGLFQIQKDPRECQNACSHALCCFANDANPSIEPCVHNNIDWCYQYQACNATLSPLEGNKTIEAEANDGNESQSMVSETATRIREVCIETPQPELCLELCAPGECCFRHHDCDKSTHDDTHNCLVYASCYVNYNETDDDDIVMSEDEEAGLNNTLDGSEREGETGVANEIEGIEVEAATDIASVEQSTVALVNPQEADDYNRISEACHGSTVDEVQPLCAQLCEPAKCCFDHNNCPPDNVVCERYASCFVVYGVTDDDDDV